MKHLMSRRIGPALVGLLLVAGPASADDQAALIEFFAGQGCAIGPSTRDAAIAAGFTAGDVDALAAAEAGREGAVASGDWLVMAPQICRMRLPEISGELSLSDADVAAAFSAPDAYLDQDSPGCFLTGPLLDDLPAARGWDADKAADEYYRLLARSIISGELTFYSDSPLLTPMGFQLTSGACGDAAPMDEIRRSHEFLLQNFDPIMRTMQAENSCEPGRYTGLISDINLVPGNGEGTGTDNAWIGLEATVIGQAAGWYEGQTATEKGTPRPPLCQYGPVPRSADDRWMARKTRHN